MSPKVIQIFTSLVTEKLIQQKLKGEFPNVPTKTLGGEVFWNNIASCDGWKIQRNQITGHCRILDPENVRHAWGSMSAMESLFMKFEK